MTQMEHRWLGRMATGSAPSLGDVPLTRALPTSLLPALDTLGMCVSLAIMGHRYGEEQPWGAFAGIFAVFHVTMARAIIVPSSALRTLLITGESFVGLLISQC